MKINKSMNNLIHPVKIKMFRSVFMMGKIQFFLKFKQNQLEIFKKMIKKK